MHTSTTEHSARDTTTVFEPAAKHDGRRDFGDDQKLDDIIDEQPEKTVQVALYEPGITNRHGVLRSAG